MTLKEKLINVANGLESESIRYPRMKTIDVVNMLINISNMEFDESDQSVQIAKDYAEKEAIEFGQWMHENTVYSGNGFYSVILGFEKHKHNQTLTECYQLFKNRENER